MQAILREQQDTLRDIEGHASYDRSLQVAQLHATYKNLKDNNRTVDTLKDINNSVKAASDAQVQAVQDASQLEEASRSSINSYTDFARGRGSDDSIQQRGLMGMFDLSEGKSQGLLGRFIRNRVARDQFVRDEQAINPNANAGDLKRRFNESVRLSGQQEDVSKEVDRLRAAGRSDDEIKATGLVESLDKLNNAITQLTRPNIVVQSDPLASAVNATGATDRSNRSLSAPRILSQTTAGLIGTDQSDPLSAQQEEREVENLRMMEEQNEMIRVTRENSEYLPLIYEKISQADRVVPEESSSDQGGSSGLLGAKIGRAHV
jgi:hypothetical protein